MNAKKVMRLSLIISATSWLATGCRFGSSNDVSGGERGGASNLTSIEMGLPDERAIRGAYPDATINAYQLEVVGSGQSTCSQVNTVGDTSQPRVKAPLVRGCDYKVTLSLGFRQNAQIMALQTVMFKNTPPAEIKRQDLEGQAQISVPINLQPFNGPTPNLVLPTPNIPNAQIVPPNSTPAPSTNVVLPTEKDVALLGTGGANSKLSEHFKGEFLMIDFSASGCGPCISAARRMNKDEKLKKMFDGTKCSAITIAAKGDLEQWIRVAGGDVGQHSFTTSSGMSGITKPLGTESVTATPTFILIDKTGKVIERTEGDMPNAIQSSCN